MNPSSTKENIIELKFEKLIFDYTFLKKSFPLNESKL